MKNELTPEEQAKLAAQKKAAQAFLAQKKLAASKDSYLNAGGKKTGKASTAAAKAPQKSFHTKQGG